MQRNRLRRRLAGLALAGATVAFLGCPPPADPSRTDDTQQGSNTSDSAGPQDSQPAPTTTTPPTPPTPATGGDDAASDDEEASQSSISASSFGVTSDNQEVAAWTLTNDNGMVVRVMEYGASLLEVEVPDREGNLANVNLMLDDLQAYEGEHHYLGATVGRYCNRIALGKFTLDGVEYELATNNEPNHLHGGDVGFNHRLWSGEPFEDADSVGVKFTYVSPDGEEKYPGEVAATVTYALAKASNDLRMDFTATTTKACPVNIANHSYWNLGGDSVDPENTILDHVLTINADQYLPVDDTLIPTGELADVEGTVFDFRSPKVIREDIEELRAGPEGSDDPGCYDHNFVLREPYGEPDLRVTLVDPESGRQMDIYSTQPGVQFYTGNFLSGSEENSGYHQHAGLCLEMQHWPDSPNQPSFPNSILRPGETYHETTIHKFSVVDDEEAGDSAD